MITEAHFAQVDKLLAKAVEHGDLLTDWENDFVSDFAEKLELYGEKIRISDKQQEILNRIERKIS